METPNAPPQYMYAELRSRLVSGVGVGGRILTGDILGRVLEELKPTHIAELV